MTQAPLLIFTTIVILHREREKRIETQNAVRSLAMRPIMPGQAKKLRASHLMRTV